MTVPLHNHSEYSAIDGLSRASEVAQRCVELGCPCCGLTDHGVIAGHLEFSKELTKVGVKPIFGCELYHGTVFSGKKPKRDQAHLIALAMTDQGLRNLWRLNDIAGHEEKFHHVGRNSWDDLERYHEGIVFTSACPAGLVAKGVLKGDYQDLNHYLDIMGDDFYIELTTYPGDSEFMDKDLGESVSIADLNRAKYQIAQERGIPVVYGDDAHYAFKHQFPAHDAYVAKASRQSIFTPIDERTMYHPEGALCIKSEEEIRQALSYLPQKAVDEAITNSVAIGERANASLPEVKRHLPVFVPNESPWVEEKKYADDEGAILFLDLVTAGMHERYGESPSQEVIDQTYKECDIFLDSGLYHYFLLAWDVMQFCDNAPERPIERGPGRGSSAACIVAYELGITDIDPLRYDLVFERFWNPGRAKGFPDIDSDFEQYRRHEVKEYLTRRWGHDRVRSIGTINRMKPKSLINAMASACGVKAVEADQLKKIIDRTPDLEILGTDQIGWSRDTDPGKIYYIMEEVGDKIVEWVEEQPTERREVLAGFLDLCDTLCNRVFTYGVHASGIIISDTDLPEIAPCRFAGSPTQRIPVTQFPMDEIEALQLVKFDALGLRTLDVLADWKGQMQKEGIDIEWSGLEHEEQNPEMWEMLAQGLTAGIFQVESGYAKKLAKGFKPQSVSDLSAIVALNRPGPIRSGAPESFIKRRAGEEEITFDHPYLEDILSKTYGFFLYQEAVIRFFTKLGYSESDADAVRKILGKKQPEKWLDLFHGRDEWKGKGYIEVAASQGLGDLSQTEATGWNGQDIENLYPNLGNPAWTIWSKIVSFAKYSFNLAHSVAYGTVGFRTTFAKYYGPYQYYISCIRNVDKNKKAEQMSEFIGEARGLGIGVRPPDIQYSQGLVTSYNNDILFGFSDVKNVGKDAAKYLVELRESGDVDVTTPETLSDSLAELSKEFNKEKASRKAAGLEVQAEQSPKMRLKANQIAALFTAGAWDRLGEREESLQVIQKCEREMLDVVLTDNTVEVFQNNTDKISDCDTYEDASQPYEEDVRYYLPGIVYNIRPTVVKASGEPMGIVTIEYNGASLEFAVFPKHWQQYQWLFKERTPGIFKIKHSMSRSGRAGYHFEEGQKLL